ncbi:DUF2267 domain-containing protein [Archangium lansingense]|uniref:DUF2267 domain-containing protein n=1 Tax=Archangium lansingense TaxID=2995310 RepID=A0ABT4AN20_9BACT|nr:DUF2267 domain-containing protein [Archangium lansinium]MCY1082716.1 DUF2267 domain-containing protein [Archangium lansinium]
MADTPTGGPLSRSEKRHQSHLGSSYAAFIKHLAEAGKLEAGVVECAAVSVVNALLHRIQPDEAKDLQAQLPRKLLEFLPKEGGEKPARSYGRTRDDFLKVVAEDLGKDVSEVEPIVRAVFLGLREHISEGEAQDVESNLPRDLQDLWRRTQ